MTESVTFSVGNQVVYPSHGVGKVKAIESQKIAGFDMKMYVIEFEKDKMVLKVPVSRAQASGLRHLSTDNLIEKAMQTIKGRAKAGRGMWSRRAQEYEQKINSGDLLLVAEVIRDLHKNVDDPDRSYSERVIYEAALNRLAGEVAAIRKIVIDDATEVLVNILKAQRAKAKRAQEERDGIEDLEEAA